MDALASQDERCLRRTAKPCGPDAPTLASSLWSDPQATVAKEPGRRGEHRISRRTIAQGRPDCFGKPVVTTLVRFFCLRARLRVHRAPGFPCALLLLEGCLLHSSGKSCRGNAEPHPLGCLTFKSRVRAVSSDTRGWRGSLPPDRDRARSAA